MRTTVLLIVVLLLPAASVRGQDMINVSTPLNTAGDFVLREHRLQLVAARA